MFIAIGLLLLFFTCPSAYSDIYRYRDEKGVWHFSNMRSNKHYKLYRSGPSKRRAKHISGKRIEKYNEYIVLASKLFRVEKPLIKAIIKAESNFDCRAVSSKGAQGLMQLMPGTADKILILTILHNRLFLPGSDSVYNWQILVADDPEDP